MERSSGMEMCGRSGFIGGVWEKHTQLMEKREHGSDVTSARLASLL